MDTILRDIHDELRKIRALSESILVVVRTVATNTNGVWSAVNQNQGTLMTIQDQTTQIKQIVDDLRNDVATQATALANLQAAVDAEQQQIGDILANLQQDNPDLAQAITDLQSLQGNLQAASDAIGAVQSDVEGTV